MRNQYFQFKQFHLQHGDLGLKTTTEACIFGAWMTILSSEKRILDIGSGTGLLSLMVAQRFEVDIDAVEINAEMVELCHLNFSKSPWKSRVKVIQSPIQQFKPEKKYDLIFSNPPFFRNHLAGKSATKNMALHDQLLSQEDLFTSVSGLLSDQGRFAVMYPKSEAEKLAILFETNGFYCNEKLFIKDTLAKSVLRVIQVFSRITSITNEETLIIKKIDGDYTEEFIRYLKPYYLRL